MQRAEINEFYAHFHVSRDLLELRRESRELHFSRDYPELAAPAAATILVPPVA